MADSKQMTYGDGMAIMILVAIEMGLTPSHADDAKSQLEGRRLHAMTAKSMEDAAVSVNDQLRHDATLIAKANEHAARIATQYGFA